MNEDFINLATRVITREANIDEEEQLKQLLDSSAELRKLYEELNLSWEEAAKLSQDSFAAEDWQKLDQRISSRKVIKLPGSFYKWSIAASLVLIAAVSFFMLNRGNMETIAAVDADTEYTLPDGSQVSLKKGSTLSYTASFSDNRKTELKGEGFFQVKKDATHPFTITTGATETTVLGTAFLVKEDEKDHTVRIFVKEGKVRFANKEAGEQILLAGDEAVFLGKKIEKRKSAAKNLFSWVEKELRFENTPMEEVAEELSHYYNIEIDTRDMTPGLTFNGTFKNNKPEEVKNILEQSLGDLQITVEKNKWIIKGGRK